MPREQKKNLVSDYLSPIGAKGGRQRAKNVTAKERSEVARRASRARWAKVKKRTSR
jgi:hypothetical protein